MTQGSSPRCLQMKPILGLWVLGALIVALLLSASDAPAQIYSVLHSFCSDGNCWDDGYVPEGPLSQASDGNLYGTTVGRLDGTTLSEGFGTVFKMAFGGSLTTVHDFCMEGTDPFCLDGAGPSGGLIQATNGAVYGTTARGGTRGGGIIFELTPGGLTDLYNFCGTGTCPGGTGPIGLAQASDGVFYGMAAGGGYNHYGTIISITAGGSETTLYRFCGDSNEQCLQGAYPNGSLMQAADGFLYGTAMDGGSGGGGTVFKLAHGEVTALYTFCSPGSCPDGAEPTGGLVQAPDGNFYGTTFQYGGSIFKLTPDGELTTLYKFDCTPCPDGDIPNGPLVQATDGNFYGTTNQGGANNAGTIFRVTPGGVLTTLYRFCSGGAYPISCPDGEGPATGLIQATDGNLYGTTPFGGDCGIGYGCGVVFMLNVGLGPFVALRTKFGDVGATVNILGTNLTGATNVTFNGTSATFTVNSSGTSIAATVPSGATTGTVQVVTPNGTLQSNVVYRVK